MYPSATTCFTADCCFNEPAITPPPPKKTDLNASSTKQTSDLIYFVTYIASYSGLSIFVRLFGILLRLLKEKYVLCLEV